MPFGIFLASRGVSVRNAAVRALALSFTLELLQYVVPGRDPSARDIAANTLGATAAAACLSARAGQRVMALMWRVDALARAAVSADGPAAAVLSPVWSLVIAVIIVGSVLLLAPSPPGGARYSVRGPILDPYDGPLVIGMGDDDSYFHGLIDEVRIYGRALAASEVRSDATRPVAAGAADPGLIAAYAFDDTDATVARDTSGNGHDAAVRGAAWTHEGRFGSALAFDGVHSHVIAPASPEFRLVDAMTLEAWIYPIGIPTRWSGVIDTGPSRARMPHQCRAPVADVGG